MQKKPTTRVSFGQKKRQQFACTPCTLPPLRKGAERVKNVPDLRDGSGYQLILLDNLFNKSRDLAIGKLGTEKYIKPLKDLEELVEGFQTKGM